MPAVAKDTGTNFTPAPEGVHQAVCVDIVVALKVPRKNKKNEDYLRDEVTLVWQIDKTNPENNNKRFLVRRLFGFNLASTGHLRPFLESWRGRKFTQDELKGFDLEKLLGVNCNLQIIHNGEWANVQNVMPLGPAQPKLEPLEYVRKEAETQPATTAEAIQTAGVATDDEVPF